ncbi:YdeI/OmpD-associated family protein [uncultured Winogradskyella sp.]|uniref:YdeI/OmpD-associated family protein n=1 Tax=uncultured Winogradskyella sp. TaxID=395353 RepID=UPI0026276683|nr:YdeI/OmpD-associated family protein [uncultured Winogradskyella sp.]
MEFPELYFERSTDWYDWLLTNHNQHKAVYLIFYKLETGVPTMRWEEAVKIALCFGWIDSTVKSLGNGKRRQYFSPRNPKSSWSALNKKYIIELEAQGLIQESGYKMITLAKKTGKWTEMDDVENGVIPKDLQLAFDKNPRAYENYLGFSKSYRKGYLSWLNSAKREATKEKRISEIIRLCNANIKSRNTW